MTKEKQALSLRDRGTRLGTTPLDFPPLLCPPKVILKIGLWNQIRNSHSSSLSPSVYLPRSAGVYSYPPQAFLSPVFTPLLLTIVDSPCLSFCPCCPLPVPAQATASPTSPKKASLTPVPSGEANFRTLNRFLWTSHRGGEVAGLGLRKM